MRVSVRLLGLLLALATLSTGQVSIATPAVAQASSIDLSQYKGKVVYLDFWASWCGPCKLSFPYMRQIKQHFRRDDFVVLTVNVDRNRAAADAFLRENGVGLPVIYDSQGDIAKDFKVSDMPTSVLIDRSGKVRFVHKGYHSNKQAEYTSHIEQLVKEH